MADATSETLKQQFQLLQKQQQEKLLRRKKKKEEKDKSNLSSAGTNRSVSFGIDDNLDLKLADPVPKESGYLSEELVEHLNNQIRELKDENARAYKLLSEKDFEVRQIKKKTEDQARAAGGVTNETAATKIVDLSKRIRELTAELESERTKSKTYARKCQELQKQISNIPEETRSALSSAVSLRTLTDEKPEDHVDVKPLQDKIKHMEAKVSEYRNQCSSLKQELKIAHKVLSQELGENVNIQSILNSQSNWRGRAQQIIGLQMKLEDLKTQLGTAKAQKQEYDLEAEMMGTGFGSARSRTAVDKHKEQLKKLDKERKDAQEKAANDLKALEEEHTALKKKFDAAKSRNSVLSTQAKTHKEQMKRLVEKGQHDDELIDALMRQQSMLKQQLEDLNKNQNENTHKTEKELKQMTMKSQHDLNIVEQLKSIVLEKESKVHKLEKEIEQLKLNHLQKAQIDSASKIFEQQTGPRPPSILQQYFESRPSTAGNNVNVEYAVSSVTPSQSRMSDRPPSVNSALDRCPSVTSTVDTARTVTPKGLPKTPTIPAVSNVDKQKIDDLQAQCREFQTLRRVAEVERDKLSELVQLLQSRSDVAARKLTDCQSDLVQERRKNALLEKQAGKNKIEQANNKGGSAMVKRKGMGRASSTTNISVSASFSASNMFDDDDLDNIEEIKTNLEIQKDENAALKAALESTLRAKEEDLKLYSEMMEETKQVFLQALRQYKQNVQGT